MKLKDLPLSSQVFEDVVGSKSLYVDKTGYIHKMVTQGHDTKTGMTSCPKFFLSRPRRFGKSMTVSALKAVFEGKDSLFEDLAIGKTDYRFDAHPILHLDWSKLDFKTPLNLSQDLAVWLSYQSTLNGLNWDHHLSFKAAFSLFLEQLAMRSKIAILIDEYDAPSLEVLKDPSERSRRDQCKAMIDVIRDFYLVLKANDANLRLVFITGVSKFSQVSVFSGLNNLQDISMSEDYAGLCGYTQEELERYFEPYIQRLADKQDLTVSETLEKLKYYYNGYRFSPNSALSVYNPFSVLHSFENRMFDTKWFQSGTPSFLVEWIGRQQNAVETLEGKRVESTAFDAKEPHQTELISMMIQTGYLTIRNYNIKTDRYILDYPNYEVKKGFMDGLLTYFNKIPLSDLSDQLDTWKEWVEVGDWAIFFKSFNRMLAGVPYHLHMPKEAYYHSIFHCVIALLGLRIQSEFATSRGRIDTFIETQEAYWIFEFKYAKNESDYDTQLDKAFYQPRKKGYLEPFDSAKSVRIMGVVFDGSLKQVVKWEEGSAT